MTPRVRGAVILLGASVCIGLNVAVMRAWHEYYALLFPFAFAMVPVGVTLLITGARPEDMRAGRFPRATWFMVTGMLVGVLAGFLVNRAVAR
jgi:drug/metabolite transporter (DMT)-like permease